MKKKNWIQAAHIKKGALHRQLGVKAGHKIPAGTLRRAASKGGVLGRRARLAETLKGLHHKNLPAVTVKTMATKKAPAKKMAAKHKKAMPSAMKMCKKCGKKHAAGKCMKMKKGKK